MGNALDALEQGVSQSKIAFKPFESLIEGVCITPTYYELHMLCTVGIEN